MSRFTEQITSNRAKLWEVIELMWNDDLDFRRMAVRLDFTEEELADEIDRMREHGHALDPGIRSEASNKHLFKVRPPEPPVPETAWERALAYWRDHTEGFCYFIRSGNSGRVKIGMARKPSARLGGLQTGSAEPLRILHIVPGYDHAEAHFHQQLASSRTHGEWFEGPEVEATIEWLDGESDAMIETHRETGELPTFAIPTGPTMVDPETMDRSPSPRGTPARSTPLGSAPDHDRPWGSQRPDWMDAA